MPSLIPVLCFMPWEQKDTLGYIDSMKVKHGAIHVENGINNRHNLLFERQGELKNIYVG
jgi:hypothetical protein